ncbi:MAG: alpha/beta hydrolase [Crocinitomicaceae bacterium]
MKVILAISALFCLGLGSCNLAKWNQNRLTKKFDRHDVTEAVLDTNGHSIHYFEGGNIEGDVILLIHGFGGDAQVTWNKTIVDLSDEYRIIAPDLLWFGESISNHSANIYAQIDAMGLLLDHLKVDTFSVAGISYGGFVTMGLVQTREDQVDKMVIIDSPGITYDVNLLDSMVVKTRVDEVSDIFVPKSPNEVQFLLDFASYKNKNVPKGILEDAYELYFSKNHEQLRQLLISLPSQKDEFLKRGYQTELDAYVLWGEFDEVFPITEAQKLSAYLNAELLVIRKAGHAPNLERYRDFEKKFRSCLDN